MYKLTPQYQQISILTSISRVGSSFPPTIDGFSWRIPLSGTSMKNAMLNSSLLKQDVRKFLFVLPLAHILSRRQPELPTGNYVSSLQKIHIISISFGSHLFSLNARSPTLLWCILERDSRLSSLWKSMK